MKHGKRLTLRQKRLLAALGMDPRNYLYCKSDAESYIFMEKASRKMVPVRR